MSNALKNVLVTGCSSGIGRCIALGLNQAGYRVIATARKEQDLGELSELGVETLALELRDTRSIQSCMAAVTERTGGQLFGLVNNAAFAQPGAVEDLRREVLRDQFEVNVFGTQEITNRVIPLMRPQNYGRIVHIGSILGRVSMAFRGAYCASKYALEGLADTQRQELQGSGLSVSLIEPGPISSQFRDNAMSAFDRNIVVTGSAHRGNYDELSQILAGGDGRSPAFAKRPEAVLSKVKKALESHSPKARYYVTTPAYLMAGMKRVLPTGVLDRILRRASGMR
ncbi:MAG: SDR family NAD(P)-dependent oxidoreductase [Pseudomonadota bacterium]